MAIILLHSEHHKSKYMNNIIRTFVFSIFILFNGCIDDSNFLCAYKNKNITVYNNTGFEILVTSKGAIFTQETIIGRVQPFMIKEFEVSSDIVRIQAGVDDGSVFFVEQLNIEACQKNFELIVEN